MQQLLLVVNLMAEVKNEAEIIEVFTTFLCNHHEGHIQAG